MHAVFLQINSVNFKIYYDLKDQILSKDVATIYITIKKESSKIIKVKLRICTIYIFKKWVEKTRNIFKFHLYVRNCINLRKKK